MTSLTVMELWLAYQLVSADGTPGDEFPLHDVLLSLQPGTERYFHIVTECAAAGITVPTTSEVINALQGLITRGYIVAWPAYGAHESRSVLDIDDPNSVPVDLALTHAGEEAAEVFQAMLETEGARQIRAQLSAEYIAERSRDLTFAPRIPARLPADVHAIPTILVSDDEDRLELKYSSIGGEFTGLRLIVEQTTKEFTLRWPLATEFSQEKIFSGTPVTLIEQQMSANWSIIRADWRSEGTMFRVVSLWSAPHRKEMPIDDEMRAEALGIVDSMLD